MSQTFEDMGVFTSRNTNLTGEGNPEIALGALMSPGLLGLLGTQPVLGRAFTPEDAVGDSRTVILSDALWRDRFGSDPPSSVARSV